MRLECCECAGITPVKAAIMRQKRKAGLVYKCTHCPANLITTGFPPKRGRSDDQKRSKKQEVRVAKRLGAQRQVASGSLSGAKGDVRKAGEIRGECKFTRAKSFTLKLEELMKIEREAAGEEQPALFIEFQCQLPAKRYVVIPEWVYEYYVGLVGDQ